MIVNSVKLCIGTIPGDGVNLPPCFKLASILAFWMSRLAVVGWQLSPKAMKSCLSLADP